jgi:hypothetical protein
MRLLRLWLTAPDVARRLCATTWRNDLSVATSRSTLTLPSASASRVHSVIALGVGSPDMTPSEKRPWRASAAGRAEPRPAAIALGERIAVAAAVPARTTNWRRVCTVVTSCRCLRTARA